MPCGISGHVKVSGVNPEEKSGAGVREGSLLTVQCSSNSCQSVLVSAIPLGRSAVWRGRIWCLGNNLSSCPGLLLELATSTLSYTVETREAADWWEEFLDLSGQLPHGEKFGSSLPNKCCPTTVCLPHWVHGVWNVAIKQTARLTPCKERKNNKHRKIALTSSEFSMSPDWKQGPRWVKLSSETSSLLMTRLSPLILSNNSSASWADFLKPIKTVLIHNADSPLAITIDNYKLHLTLGPPSATICSLTLRSTSKLARLQPP